MVPILPLPQLYYQSYHYLPYHNNRSLSYRYITYVYHKQIATFLLLSPLYKKYWSLSYRYLPHITSKYISPFSTGTCTSPLSPVLVPALPVHTLYHKYWSLVYRYIFNITSTGPCPTGTSPISLVLVIVLPVPQTGTSTISHALVPVLPLRPLYHNDLVPVKPVYPLYHKYWSLSYSDLPCITRACPTYISPNEQLLDPALQVHPLYHKNWTMSERYILYITGPTDTSLLSYWAMSCRYLLYITSTGPCPIDIPISKVLFPADYHLHHTF